VYLEVFNRDAYNEEQQARATVPLIAEVISMGILAFVQHATVTDIVSFTFKPSGETDSVRWDNGEYVAEVSWLV
jgi:hypothetical protein